MEDSLREFTTRKNLVRLAVLAIIILVIPLGVYLARQQQILRTKAVGEAVEFVEPGVEVRDGPSGAVKVATAQTVGLKLKPPDGWGAPVNVKWDMIGTYTVKFNYTDSSTGKVTTFTHNLQITDSNLSTGAFSGVGQYVAIPGEATQATWTVVSGTQSDDSVSFVIANDPYDGLPPYSVESLSGTIDAQGNISGRAKDSEGSEFAYSFSLNKPTLIPSGGALVPKDLKGVYNIVYTKRLDNSQYTHLTSINVMHTNTGAFAGSSQPVSGSGADEAVTGVENQDSSVTFYTIYKFDPQNIVTSNGTIQTDGSIKGSATDSFGSQFDFVATPTNSATKFDTQPAAVKLNRYLKEGGLDVFDHWSTTELQRSLGGENDPLSSGYTLETVPGGSDSVNQHGWILKEDDGTGLLAPLYDCKIKQNLKDHKNYLNAGCGNDPANTLDKQTIIGYAYWGFHPNTSPQYHCFWTAQNESLLVNGKTCAEAFAGEAFSDGGGQGRSLVMNTDRPMRPAANSAVTGNFQINAPSVSCVNGKAAVNLSWTKSTYPSDANFHGYQIRRTKNGGATQERLFNDDVVTGSSGNTSVTSYQDSSVEAGNTYNYHISAWTNTPGYYDGGWSGPIYAAPCQ